MGVSSMRLVCVISYVAWLVSCAYFQATSQLFIQNVQRVPVGSILGAPEFVPQAFARTFPLVLVRGLAVPVRVSEETEQVFSTVVGVADSYTFPRPG